VQNIFIAIIQQGFGSLSENPPKRGDESDDDSDEENADFMAAMVKKNTKNVKKLKDEETRRKAQDALKMILSVNKRNQNISEETRGQLLLMDSVAKNIADNLWKLIAIAEPLPSQKVNREALKFYLATTCQLKIKDALERVKKNIAMEEEEEET
jgi:hypothetical protein